MKITNDTLLKTVTLKGAVNCAAFEQTKSEQPIARTHNWGLTKVAAQCSGDTFDVNQNLVLYINICGKNPAHRKICKTLAAALQTNLQSETSK